MEINKNFVFGLVISIIATMLNGYYQFIETEWYLFIGPAFLLCLPWKINNDIFSLFGGWNDEGSVYSLCPVFQEASKDTFGYLSISYQNAGRNALQVLGLAWQEAGEDALHFLGLAWQEARGNAVQATGLAYQKAGGKAEQVFGIAWQEVKGVARQDAGLRVFASGDTITRGTFLAIPPIASKEKGALETTP